MSRTKSDTKTPIQLKKELTEARKIIDVLNNSLEAKNETIEGLEYEKKELTGLVKKHKVMHKIFRGESVEYKHQRNTLMVSVQEMKNTHSSHAEQIADKALSECTPLRYYSTSDLESIIEKEPLYDAGLLTNTTSATARAK